MKIILILGLTFFAILFSVEKLNSSNGMNVNTQNIYFSEKYGYSIAVPKGFEVNDDVPELVSVENFDSRLRVNAGCLESGLENLLPVMEPVTLNGIPALKEDFYDQRALRVRRVTVSNKKGQCFFLEEVAETENGWQELVQIRKTFQFVD